MHNTLVTTLDIVICFGNIDKQEPKSISPGSKIINVHFLGFKVLFNKHGFQGRGWTVFTYIQHCWCSAQRSFLKTFSLLILKLWTSNKFGRNHAKLKFFKNTFWAKFKTSQKYTTILINIYALSRWSTYVCTQYQCC